MAQITIDVELFVSSFKPRPRLPSLTCFIGARASKACLG